MDDSPPRRSRRPPKKSNDSSLPLIPILIGVIVLGFVIGAALSLGGKGGKSEQVVVVASPTPIPEPTATERPTLAPLATRRPSTAAPLQTPATAEPTTTPSPKPSTVPSQSPTPSPVPSHAHVVAVVPKATAAATTTATATPTPAATAVPPRATPVVTLAPSHAPRATIAPSPAPPAVTPSPAPLIVTGTTIDADSDFGRLSASVVRQYLRALARGDTESAYGAFGATPGSANVTFSERPVMSANAQIGAITARGSNDTQTVNVTITSDAGTYYGTYGVRRSSTGAAIITSHAISKG